MAVGYLIGGGGGAVIALLIAAATNLFSYWNADKLVLSMHDAQEVDERSAPEFVAILRELAQRAGLPMPRVYLMDSPQPNAFATGRNPRHAAVCATTGLLNTLSRDEVAAVIGHELGHVRNHDTLTMTITATIAGAISMLAKGHTIRVWRNGPERQKKHRVVRDAAPVRHKLHAGQGPGLFRTLSDRCNEHCLRSASPLRRRSFWVNHRRIATAKPYEQHSGAGAEVFSVGSSGPRFTWAAGSFAFRP